MTRKQVVITGIGLVTALALYVLAWRQQSS
jgi:hypothetical protein